MPGCRLGTTSISGRRVRDHVAESAFLGAAYGTAAVTPHRCALTDRFGSRRRGHRASPHQANSLVAVSAVKVSLDLGPSLFEQPLIREPIECLAESRISPRQAKRVHRRCERRNSGAVGVALQQCAGQDPLNSCGRLPATKPFDSIRRVALRLTSIRARLNSMGAQRRRPQRAPSRLARHRSSCGDTSLRSLTALNALHRRASRPVTAAPVGARPIEAARRVSRPTRERRLQARHSAAGWRATVGGRLAWGSLVAAVPRSMV